MKALSFFLVCGFFAAGCSHATIHDGFGSTYHDLFNTQAADRGARDPAPVRADELRRIISAYYGSLAGDAGGAAGGSGGNSGTSTSSGPGVHSLSVSKSH